MLGDKTKRLLVYGISRVFPSLLRNFLLNALLGTRKVYYGASIDIAQPSRVHAAENVFIGKKSSLKAKVILKRGVKVGDGTVVDDFENKGGSLVLEENVSVNFGCIFDASGEILISKNSSISPLTIIYTHNHRHAEKNKLIREQGVEIKPVSIGQDVWVGARSLILPGVSVGNGCVIGAGSIVTKSAKPYSIIAGVPAKVIGWRK